MSLSRRDLLKIGGISIAGGIVGSMLKDSLLELSLSNKFKPYFEVHIFKDNEEALKHIPEQLSYIAERGSYLKIGLSKRSIYDSIRIFDRYDELELIMDTAYIKRPIRERNFDFIVSSIESKPKKYKFTLNFLDNESLLEIVIKHLSGIQIVSNFYPENIHYEIIPKSIQFEKDNVSYKINDLEALTKGDKKELENKLEILKTIKNYS